MYNPYNPYSPNYGQFTGYNSNGVPINNQNVQQAQLQDGGFVAVQSKEEAQNYLVANGTSVTFIDRAAKKLYVKINSFSPLDAPIFESYSLVKDEDSAPTPAPARSTDEDIKELKSEVEKLKAEVGKLTDIITDYETREAMKKEEMKGGYSQHYPPYMWEDRMRGNSYDGMSRGDYSEEGSYRRGRDANTGRYVSRDSSYEGSYDGSYGGSYDRYSRDEAEDQMKQKLMDMMNEAKTDKAKNALRQAIEGLR